jgi:spermidine/putrescine transport system ATP-binding protein
MVLEPDVLLLDEPLGALDLKLRERMKIELKLLQHQFDTTFLYITHDQSEALVMSDNVAVMNAGRFEQIGTPQELYHDPRTAFVAGFVGDSNRWPGRISAVDGEEARIDLTSGGTTVARLANGRAAPGEAVDVFVRPEAIVLARPGAARAEHTTNRRGGTVDSLLFNGANSRILVRSGEELIEVDLTHPGGGEMRPGDPVELAWAPSRALAFRAAG